MAIFGPAQKVVWQQLAHEIGAYFVKGKLTRPHRVELMYRNWIITLDTFSVNTGNSSMVYTRMRAPYICENDIQFKLTKRNIFSGFSSIFKKPIIETYDYEFNNKYVIRGNDETVIKEIFQNQSIKEKIVFQKNLNLKIIPYNKKRNEAESELYFQTSDVLKDIDKLKNLFSLFSELLDEFVKNGVASLETPATTL